MSEPDGFQEWVRLARAGDEAAAARLAHEFEPFIRRFVRFRMRGRSDRNRLRPELDSADICQSVFKSLFVGLRGGRFELAGPEQLQKLLAAMVRFKVATKARRLSLFRPLSWNLQVVHALTAFALADYQAEDGRIPDVQLILKAERICEGLLRLAPTSPMIRGNLVLLRRRLAEELHDRGRTGEATVWSRRSLETARGDTELLYNLARDYAHQAGITGTYPTGLDAERLRERRRRFVNAAIAMLHQAAVDGFKDAARLRGDAGFDPIRSDPGFRAVLGEIGFPADPFASR